MEVGEGRVVEPAVVGGPPYQEARVHEDPGEQEDPIAERVQAREGHVARPYHERDEVVSEPEQHRCHEPEDHRDAVHREELVVGLWVQQMLVRAGQLGPQQHGFDPAGGEEEERGVDVVLADLLVIDRVQPGAEAGRLLPDLLEAVGDALGGHGDHAAT